MKDEGKDAGLRSGDPQSGAVAGKATPPRRSPLRPPAADGGMPDAAAHGGLSEHTRNRLAAQLRAMYDMVARQPVPDRFAALIAQLDGTERDKP